MASLALERWRGGGGARAHGLGQIISDPGGNTRHVAQEYKDPGRIWRQDRRGDPKGGAHALGVISGVGDGQPVRFRGPIRERPDRRRHRLAVRPGHHHHAPHRRGEGGGERAVEQDPALPGRQQLAAAEPGSRSGRQHDRLKCVAPCHGRLILSMLPRS
ncbi:hypothetical protein GALL_542440 [mine drainage metagenome]|uniref:Uncharacterized protein n=1 Tax=mine drainage metagenome TaxID=410659 RepID=A0A1J5NZF1_9ZZZZ